MTRFRIGDRVAHEGRVYQVRDFSPMSVRPRQVLLEDAVRRQMIEVAEAELAAAELVARESWPER